MTVGQFLARAAVVASAPRLVIAMIEAGTDLGTGIRSALLFVSAVGTALAIVAGIAYILPLVVQRRSLGLGVALALMLAAEGLLQTPVVLADLRGVRLPSVLGEWDVAWAILATLAPALVAGVLLAAEQSAPVALALPSPVPEAPPVESAAQLAARTCARCGKVLKSPSAKAGHMRSCQGGG